MGLWMRDCIRRAVGLDTKSRRPADIRIRNEGRRMAEAGGAVRHLDEELRITPKGQIRTDYDTDGSIMDERNGTENGEQKLRTVISPGTLIRFD